MHLLQTKTLLHTWLKHYDHNHESNADTAYLTTHGHETKLLLTENSEGRVFLKIERRMAVSSAHQVAFTAWGLKQNLFQAATGGGSLALDENDTPQFHYLTPFDTLDESRFHHIVVDVHETAQRLETAFYETTDSPETKPMPARPNTIGPARPMLGNPFA